MADDPGMEMIKAGTEGAVAGLAAPFVAAFRALFGDTVQALDDYGALKIVLRQEELRQRVIETVVRSIAMCEAAGVEPKNVGLKVGLPILQHVAVEDDEGMRERWAALLANAAAGVGGAAVSPAFPRILADLDPIEAVMLNELAVRDPWETMWLSSFRMKMGVPEQLMGDEYTSEMQAFDVSRTLNDSSCARLNARTRI